MEDNVLIILVFFVVGVILFIVPDVKEEHEVTWTATLVVIIVLCVMALAWFDNIEAAAKSLI